VRSLWITLARLRSKGISATSVTATESVGTVDEEKIP